MARRVRDVTITAAGRDQGKVFRITEMPASQAERWAARAFLALAKSSVQLPDTVNQAGLAGLAGVASAGLTALAGVSFYEAEPLMIEMFSCISYLPGVDLPSRPLIEEDIEEVATRAKLRMEAIELHTGFSLAAALSKLGSAATQTDAVTPIT